MNELLQLLSCWHKLEHFSPAAIPKGQNIKELETPLPWDINIKPSSKDKTIEHTIYLAVFNSTMVNDFVKEFFKDTSEDINQRNEKICMASFKVDIAGKYISNSFGVSTLPWALSQLEKDKIKDNEWANSFNNIKSDLLLDLEYDLNEKISINDILKIQDKVIKTLNWSVEITPSLYVKIEEKFISKRENKEDENNAEILNSFFIEDLEMIISNLNKKEIPVSFFKYMQGSLNNYGVM